MKIAFFKKSIVIKWIVLYYTFSFFLTLYLILQLSGTVLLFLLNESMVYKGLVIKGFNVTLGGIKYQLWDFPEFYIATIFSSIVIIAALLLTIKFLLKKSPLDYLGLKKMPKKQYKWLLICILVLIPALAISELLGLGKDIAISATSFLDKFLMVTSLVLFGPFWEEILFRGFLLNRMAELLKYKHQWIAILVSAILFSILHAQYGAIEVAYIFLIGLFMGFVVFKTRNLWFSIIFHCAISTYGILPFVL